MELFFIWLSVVIVFFLIELLGVSYFFFFSFSLGALISALMSLYTGNLAYQLICFLCASALAFILLRFVCNPHRSSKIVRTNVHRLPGMRGVVIKSVAPGISGQVKIEGIIWSAKVVGNQLIVEGEQVEVVSVQGSHVIVRPADSKE